MSSRVWKRLPRNGAFNFGIKSKSHVWRWGTNDILSHFDHEALLFLCMHIVLADSPPYSTSTMNQLTCAHPYSHALDYLHHLAASISTTHPNVNVA
ncbi:hypothetical protein C0J52_17689 [Blattella germanica]|nr:hypothetical protein C0J52_17689 [Blattella germanica]